tara:strand:- start:121 stop:432 length:312 start_codon:yes stop_codon:yes gene_type:complete
MMSKENWTNTNISAYAQSTIDILKKQVLELTMENAELKDMVLDNGGDYTNDKQLSLDFEVEKVSENDFKVKKPMIYESPDGGETIYGRRAGDSVREQFNRECD